MQTLGQTRACVISIGSPSWFKTECYIPNIHIYIYIYTHTYSFTDCKSQVCLVFPLVSRSFITLRLSHWWQMDYSDVFYTFLCLDSINCLAVNETVTNLQVFIQNILNCVPKKNKAFTGLERHGVRWLLTTFSFWGLMCYFCPSSVLKWNCSNNDCFQTGLILLTAIGQTDSPTPNTPHWLKRRQRTYSSLSILRWIRRKSFSI